MAKSKIVLESSNLFDLPEPIGDGKLKLTAHILKALDWYVKEHNYRAEISNPPSQMNFTNKGTGEPVQMLLDDIIDEYKAWKKADQKQRSNAMKLSKKQKEYLHKWK